VVRFPNLLEQSRGCSRVATGLHVVGTFGLHLHRSWRNANATMNT
jgi:hypothetical protein